MGNDIDKNKSNNKIVVIRIMNNKIIEYICLMCIFCLVLCLVIDRYYFIWFYGNFLKMVSYYFSIISINMVFFFGILILFKDLRKCYII